jgi:hypothetical protein
MSLTEDTSTACERAKSPPALKLNFLSHGTLESRDLAFSRRFYEEFLGLEVVQTSPISLLIRLGGANTIAVVYSKQAHEMNLLNHNGLDVHTKDEVDAAHRTVVEQAEKWRLKKIGAPRLQHGTYSFFFWDADNNCWEILSNPAGGYSWLFEQGDQHGKGHLDRNFKRPGTYFVLMSDSPTEALQGLGRTHGWLSLMQVIRFGHQRCVLTQLLELAGLRPKAVI